MKKILLIMLLAITTYCGAQERIYLTTGDSLVGTITEIDSEHSRITKSDGKSFMILNEMIKNRKDIISKQSENAGDNLILASQIIFKSIGIIVLGAGATIVGAVLIIPATAIIGGVITFGEGIYSITAWCKIKKAGECLKKNKL